MRATLITLVSLVLGLWSISTSRAAMLGAYEFTGNSLAATDADLGDGISLSDLTIGNGYGDLFDNGATDALRVSGNDTPTNSTTTAIASSAFLQFTLTNNSGTALILGSLEADYQRTNAFTYHNARVFSDVQGFDDVVGDTIGELGRSGIGVTTGDSDATPVHDILNLTALSTEFGANVLAPDFTIANGASITFTIPFLDNSSSALRWNDIDNISIHSAEIPEPSSALLIAITMATGLAMARRNYFV